MSEIHIAYIETPIAINSDAGVWLELCWRRDGITSMNFTSAEAHDAAERAPLPSQWLKALDRYWHRPMDHRTCTALAQLPVDLSGTRYQQRVWSLLQQIPAGRTASYGALSTQLMSSPRAVAAACRANPVVLAVPCHRVVAKGGLGGFMGAVDGAPVEIKQWLLAHEQ